MIQIILSDKQKKQLGSNECPWCNREFSKGMKSENNWLVCKCGYSVSLEEYREILKEKL